MNTNNTRITLAHGEGALHRIQMAHIMAELGNGHASFGAGGRQMARLKRQQAGELPQQAGLAGAVRPADKQCLAGLERKVQALEQHPPAPLTGDVTGLEADGEGRLHGAFCAMLRQNGRAVVQTRLFASLSRCRKGFYSGSKSTHPKAKMPWREGMTASRG